MSPKKAPQRAQKQWWKSPQFIGFCVVFVAVFCITGLISIRVFDSYPFSQDEYTYVRQAGIFATGRASMHTNPSLHPLREMYMLMDKEGNLFSKYPPLFSLVLALGVLLGMVALVNPFISALSAALLFEAVRRSTSLFIAICTGVLFMTNEYFLGYGSSFFAQPLAGLCAISALFGFVLYQEKHSKRYVQLAGGCVACCFFVRQVDALCLLLALSAGFAYGKPKEMWKRLRVLWGISLAGVFLLMIYNFLMVGRFSISSFPVFATEFKVIDKNAVTFSENLSLIAHNYMFNFKGNMLREFIRYFIPLAGLGIFLLALIGAIFRRNRITLVCVLFTLLLVCLYFFHKGVGWPQYGVRYWYPAFAPFALLAAFGLHVISQKRFSVIVIPVVVLISLHQLLIVNKALHMYRTRFVTVRALQHDVASQCTGRSIVLLPKVRNPVPFVSVRDLKRNTFLEGDTIFLTDPKFVETIQKQYPDYTVCWYKPTIDINALNEPAPQRGEAPDTRPETDS